MTTSKIVSSVPHAPSNIDKPLPPPPPPDRVDQEPSTPESKPPPARRATAPETVPSISPLSNGGTSTFALRSRTRSPFARGHARSKSSGSVLRAPPMTRAYSSPGPDGAQRHSVPRPVSPSGHFNRHHSPLRRPSEDSFSSFGNNLDIDQTISENAELDITPRATLDFDHLSLMPGGSSHNTFPRSRRRPASPLSQLQQGPSTPKAALRSCTSTPSLANPHFNEAFPTPLSISSSSASTPTSMRSRSPSISSLETIPDSPDAEQEAESIARLKAAADREDKHEEGTRRRSTSSDPLGRGLRDKRKRWSVCGAERRENLDLETIWEDGT